MLPQINNIAEIKLLDARVDTLANGLLCWSIGAALPNVLRLELVIPSGRWYEVRPVIAKATGDLLKEGTNTLSGPAIAETIDYYGARLSITTGSDFTIITLQSLHKYLEPLLVLLADLLQHAQFPEEEVELYKQNLLQKLKVNNERVEYHAQKAFIRALYGEVHPYGHFPEEDTIATLTRHDVLAHYSKHYTLHGSKLFVSGNLDDTAMELINRYLGVIPAGDPAKAPEIVKPQPGQNRKIFQEKPSALQSAIRMAMPGLPKDHPDYHDFRVMNTAFGGYFGSRLMSNIREDKGYTYGIYSLLHSFMHESYFCISTEVGKAVTQLALKEIYHEIERLKHDPFPADELALVRNYTLGKLLNQIDGPFKTISMVKSLVLNNLTTDHFYDYVESVKHITPERIQAIANEYLLTEKMYEVVVGDY